ncbi:MAG: 5-carboxymethyl-2-hydroxymuconate semialdehyde dehydrogenase [Thermaerobacter sp.]|nr:5-carboxymethyl-2-hydroxymuconate semialdehyde dehydrogenase [Thermaerobacter sp.]
MNHVVSPLLQHFIGGTWQDSVSGDTFADVNPATGAVITHVAAGDARDVARAVAAAAEAFHEGPWARRGGAYRAPFLERIAQLMRAHAEELSWLETLDTGIPIRQTRGQIARAAENFRFFAARAREMTGATYPVPGFLNYSLRQPVGVAGLITPWNTPLMLESWKLAPCLAAGDPLVLKPAEWSPLTADRLAHLIAEAELPVGVFNLVHGYGETAGASLVAHPGVRLISFTGETSTGRTIMQNGANTLKRFSMELGGKSPVLVFDDADLERALDAALFGMFTLNGERCTAGSRLLVQDTVADRLVPELVRRVGRIRVGDPFDETTDLGPLIHPEHWERVMSYVALAPQEGARVAVGGRRPPHLPAGSYLEATVLTGVTPGMRVAREEIFGPVLAVMTFTDEAEAVALANEVDYGLAAYVWTSDVTRAHRVAEALEAGMVWVNSPNVRDLRTPFGGSKMSGMGREGGEWSFDFYTEWKSVQVALNPADIPRLGL